MYINDVLFLSTIALKLFDHTGMTLFLYVFESSSNKGKTKSLLFASESFGMFTTFEVFFR